MMKSDMLRYTRIPTHESGSIPAAGFGTLIPDPLVTKQRLRPHWKQDFDTSIVRSATAMKRRLARRFKKPSRLGHFSARTCSLPRSYGTPIIVQSG